MWILKGKESGYGITTISRHSTRQLAEQAERRLRRKADRANGKPVTLNLFIEEQSVVTAHPGLQAITCSRSNISLPTTSDPDTVCADCGKIL